MNPERRQLLRGVAGVGLLPLVGSVGSVADATAARAGGASDVVDSTSTVWSAETAPPISWQWTDETADDGVVQDIAATADGGIVAVGHETDSTGSQNAFVRRLDRSGDAEYVERIGGDSHDAAIGVTEREDGGVVFCGGSASAGSNFLDTTVGRVDPGGEPVWLEAIGRAGTNDAAHAITSRPGGGSVAAGGTHYMGGATGDGVGRLIAIDDDGTVQWDRTYDDAHAGEIYDVITTGAGQYAFVGTRAASDGDDGRAWLGVVNAAGNLEWSETYGAAGSRIGYSLVETDDGFAFAGTTTPPTREEPTGWVVSVDDDGELLWEETYGSSGSDVALSVAESAGGGLTVAGWTDEGGADRGWLLRLDEVGRLQWEETYGAASDDRFTVHRSVGSGYAAGGYTADPDVTPSVWGLDPDDASVAGGSVEGVVTDSRGNPVESADLAFVDEETGDRWEATTSDDGRYDRELPGASSYEVVVDGTDVERTSETVRVDAGSNHELDIDVTLTPFGQRKVTKRDLAHEIDDTSLSLSERDRVAELHTELTSGVEVGDFSADAAESTVTRHIWGERLVQDANTALGPGEYSELTDYHLIHRTSRAGVEAIIKLLALPKILAKKAAAHFTDRDWVFDLIDRLWGVAEEAVSRTLDLFFTDSEPGSEAPSPRSEAEELAEEETNAIEAALDPTEPITYDSIKQLIDDAIDVVTIPVAETERLRTEIIFYRPPLVDLRWELNADTLTDDGLAGSDDDANDQFVEASGTIASRIETVATAMDTVDDGFVDDDGILNAIADVWHETSLRAFADLLWSVLGFAEDLLGVLYDISNALIGAGGYLSILAPMGTGARGVARGKTLELPDGGS